jgi:hypothetical protein
VIDEAFLPLQKMVEELTSLNGEINDSDAGVRSYIYECTLESPVELDVFRDEEGLLRIGSVPPLYYVDTTFRPVFHKLSFTARLSREFDGN